MNVIGIVCEYDPFHRGHAHHIAAAKAAVGEGAKVLCVMSGDVTQRGDFSQWDKFVRAEIALRAGADLVLELPPEAASAPARDFAAGAVELFAAAGVVTHLAFGSESGNAPALGRLVEAELSAEFDGLLREKLRGAVPYAAARQQALETLCGPEGSLVRRPNDTLGVEYLRAFRQKGLPVTPVAVSRQGAGHGETVRDGYASGSHLRALLRAGDWDAAAPYLTGAGLCLLRREAEAGRGFAAMSATPAALYCLRRASREDFEALPDCTPELAGRLYDCARRAGSVEEFLALGQAKQIFVSRVRRAALHLCLGFTRDAVKQPPAYLRVLGFSAGGQELLGRMRKTAAVPVLSRLGAGKRLGPEAAGQLARLVRVRDLRALSLPGGAEAPGTDWLREPVRI